jgi:hypothetical protein
MILNKKKNMQFCLNKTVLHPFSAMKYEISWLLDFLIVGLERAEQQRCCHKVQTSYQWVLSVGFIKYLLNAEKSRDLSHLWERNNASVATVTLEMLQRTRQKNECLLDIARLRTVRTMRSSKEYKKILCVYKDVRANSIFASLVS